MLGSIESSYFRLEKVRLRLFGNFGPSQFFDRDLAPGATVAGAIKVVPDGRTDDTGDCIDGI